MPTIRMREGFTIAGPDVAPGPEGTHTLPEDQARAAVLAGHAEAVDFEPTPANEPARGRKKG